MSGAAWITVAVTDRAPSLRALLLDIEAQRDELGAKLEYLIVENSADPLHREANLQTAARLRAKGNEVTVLDEPPYRRSIAVSRERQRAWIADRLRCVPPASFIWMLDDDNRLDHLWWDGEVLQRDRLEHHLRRLFALSSSTDRPDLLIGEVCGDPPIPPVATLASRLGDLDANLQLLAGAHPDDRAAAVLTQLPIACEFDDYYDFSEERPEPTWAKPRRWLVDDREASCAQALAQLVTEARFIPLGIGFTRTILTEPARLGWIGPGVRRGGNAIFFSPEACVHHIYPNLSVAGVETRRGDMTGAELLSRSYDVRSGGFSVRHARPRELPAPSSNGLSRSIVADTLGAALARGISSLAPDRAIATFLERRAATIDAALDAAITAAELLQERIASTPSLARWQGELSPLLSWVLREVAPARRSVGLRSALVGRETRQTISAKAVSLQRSLGEVA